MKILKRLNPALPALVLGILIYSCLAAIISFIVSKYYTFDVLKFEIGLIIGTILSIYRAVHIAKVIEEATRGETSQKMLSAKSVYRYFVVVIVIVAMMYFKLGDLIGAFVGLFGLKISAYAQPLLYKILSKVFHLSEYDLELDSTTTKEEGI